MNRNTWIGLAICLLAVVFGAWLLTSNKEALEESRSHDHKSFASLVSKAGISIQTSEDSNSYAVFGLEPGDSRIIRTDIGTMDVIAFPSAIEETVKIRHLNDLGWEVSGVGGSPIIVEAGQDLKFLVTRNILVLLHDDRLAEALQKPSRLKRLSPVE